MTAHRVISSFPRCTFGASPVQTLAISAPARMRARACKQARKYIPPDVLLKATAMTEDGRHFWLQASRHREVAIASTTDADTRANAQRERERARGGRMEVRYRRPTGLRVDNSGHFSLLGCSGSSGGEREGKVEDKNECKCLLRRVGEIKNMGR